MSKYAIFATLLACVYAEDTRYSGYSGPRQEKPYGLRYWYYRNTSVDGISPIGEIPDLIAHPTSVNSKGVVCNNCGFGHANTYPFGCGCADANSVIPNRCPNAVHPTCPHFGDLDNVYDDRWGYGGPGTGPVEFFWSFRGNIEVHNVFVDSITAFSSYDNDPSRTVTCYYEQGGSYIQFGQSTPGTSCTPNACYNLVDSSVFPEFDPSDPSYDSNIFQNWGNSIASCDTSSAPVTTSTIKISIDPPHQDWMRAFTFVAKPAPSAPSSSGGDGDPHLRLAHGGRADFRGTDGDVYNFLSVPKLSVSVKTEDAIFRYKNVTVHGSFMTEVNVVAIVGGTKQKEIKFSHLTRNANDQNWGWKMINGTCGGHHFYLGPHSRKTCEEFEAGVEASTSTVRVHDWTIIATTNYVYGWISGPKHRIDLTIFPNIPEKQMSVAPHGIIGQSYDNDDYATDGKMDVYPSSGVFHTSAQAEGAIEGNYTMYRLRDRYDTEFAFSRFHKTTSTKSRALVGLKVRPRDNTGLPSSASDDA